MKSRVGSDFGSGTILALVLIFVSIGCLGASQFVVSQLLAQARLNAVVDEAALAADDALRGLSTGYPCEIAREIAAENMVFLDECRIVGFETFINLHVQSMGIVLNATARAGPSN